MQTITQLNRKSKNELVRELQILEQKFDTYEKNLNTKEETIVKTSVVKDKAAEKRANHLLGLLRKLRAYMNLRPNFMKTTCSAEEEVMLKEVDKCI